MPIRLGGPVFRPYDSPDSWVTAVRSHGWGATTCPVRLDSDLAVIHAYRNAAEIAGILISEVGAWSNPVSVNEEERLAAIEKCKRALYVADELGALCAVTISGSKSSTWDRAHPDNFAAATFDQVVETTREIIDAVKPRRAVFSLEAMPWAFPDGPDNYLELVHAIGREGFGVHLDPVNMCCTPRRALDTAAFLKECFAKLGSHIVNIHAKDISVGSTLTFHVSEVRPGLGSLDYRTFLREASRLPQTVGFLLEHLPSEQEYADAAVFVRETAESEGISLS